MNAVFDQFTRYINEWSNGQDIKPDDLTRAFAYASMRFKEDWGEALGENLDKVLAMMRTAARKVAAEAK